MTRSTRGRWLCASLGILLIGGCGDVGGSATDGGNERQVDGSSLSPDAQAPSDARQTSDGGLDPDAAQPPPDAGLTPPDAAQPLPDARPPSDFVLDDYQAVTSLVPLSYVPADLSGITYNYDSNTFYMIRNNATRIWEVDTSYNLLRTIAPTGNFGDTEDIVYLGNDEYAIVSEEGVLYIGTIAPSASNGTMNPADFQQVSFAGPSGNSGPEGVAYDPASQTFYIVKEENPRKLYSFVRPPAGVANVTPIEPYDAQVLPMPRLTQDMSGVLFNQETGRLLILSHRDHRVVDIELDATVHGILELPTAQHEGIAFDGVGNLHIVAEPNFSSVYALP